VGLEIVFSVSEDQGSRKEIVMKIRARRWRDGFASGSPGCRARAQNAGVN
jgi:hypothetical protein